MATVDLKKLSGKYPRFYTGTNNLSYGDYLVTVQQ